MKKYLFIIPSLSKGGAERVVSVLASELIKQGRECVVVTHFRAEKEYPIEDKVKVVCLSGLDEIEYRKRINKKYLLQLAYQLRKVIFSGKTRLYYSVFVDHLYKNGYCIDGVFL